jgi:hypothetical protein
MGPIRPAAPRLLRWRRVAAATAAALATLSFPLGSLQAQRVQVVSDAGG